MHIAILVLALLATTTLVAPADAYRANVNDGRQGFNVPAAVVMLLDHDDSVRCTGTVISERLVLTAGHCEELNISSVGNRDGHVGEVVDSLRIDEVGDGDVALLVLETPTDVAPMPIAANFDRRQTGLQFRAYGSTAEVGGVPQGGTLHWTISTIRDCLHHTLLAHDLAFCGLAGGYGGDSGGAATITFNGRRIVVGVASAITTNEQAVDIVNPDSAYSEIDRWAPSLLNLLTDVEGYQRSWLRGLVEVDLSSIDFVTPTCHGLRATVVGTDGADVIRGSSPSDGPEDPVDVIVAGGGDDIIRGRGGNDHICGGAGDDFIVGGTGSDYCNGGKGSDTQKGCEEIRRM